MTNNDMELVRDYAAHQSEQAFEALVSQHVNLVYSAALRQARDPHLAEEITQAVFIILARKSGSLTTSTILSGWLYRTACYAAKDALRARRRRQHHEQEAYMQSTLHEAQADSAWQELSPLLDEAMMHLAQTDRDALVLRFFENKSSQEVGAAIEMSEEAAKKRVSRAMEKLRKYFSKRGLTSTTATIAGAISVNSLQAAPVGLPKIISAVALAKGAAASTSTLSLVKGALKTMAWSKTKAAIVVGAITLLTAGVATVSIDKSLTEPGPFVKITGRGQIELCNPSLNKARVIETANMTIWTDGKSYRIAIVSKGDGTLTNDGDDMQAQYGSDGIDTFVLSDQSSPLHRTHEGFGGFAWAGRFPNPRTFPVFVPLIVRAAWLAYCSSDYFNVSSNDTGQTLGEGFSLIWPAYVTNFVVDWTNSTLPNYITGWSRNWMLLPTTNSDQPKIATELKQYPDGFKAWRFTADDPVVVGNKQLPRRITLETFFPKWGKTIANGDDVDPLRKATFVADSITAVKGSFDPLPPVTVPDLQVMDSRFADIAATYVITSHATPKEWPTRGSQAFKQAEAEAENLAVQNHAFVQSELKRLRKEQVVIPP